MESSAHDVPAEKFRNPELHEMAVKSAAGSVSVLIEPAIPPQRVEFQRQERRGRGASIGFPEETEDQRQRDQDTIDAAESSLRELLGESPHWLKTARAFVATVNSDQLRTMARSPLIKAIHLNRKRTV